MRTVMVSGCFDPLHAGHLRFFKDARKLGDELIVCVATDEVIGKLKGRTPTLPYEHRAALIEALDPVDLVVRGGSAPPRLNFGDALATQLPDMLVATGDDDYADEKREMCEHLTVRYVQVPKTPTPGCAAVSSTDARRRSGVPAEIPLRVDFAGGWLDVPSLGHDGWIVNCAITPKVSLADWRPYEQRAGLGGSAAWSILSGRDGLESELAAGVGWQDPAVIRETGLCCWHSGERPLLEWKINPHNPLGGHIALLWTGEQHDTPRLVGRKRDYELIKTAGEVALGATGYPDETRDVLMIATDLSYRAQLDEGMKPLPCATGAARKYCGGGWGGYALYLFDYMTARDEFVRDDSDAIPVEPYMEGC